ncbi:MAG: DUF190 domain-containing protein [Rhodopila sp.]|nr:DUF190 domain-containing protein [Rhodopila sp.]
MSEAAFWSDPGSKDEPLIEAIAMQAPTKPKEQPARMQAPGEATLLRIAVGYDDTFENKPLYDQIVLKARAMEMAGATVIRGLLAYGPASREHTFSLRLSEDLPVVIDIVDTAEKIEEFLPVVDDMVETGLVTVQKVTVLRYGRKQASA